jgi:uncharacterized protein YraI
MRHTNNEAKYGVSGSEYSYGAGVSITDGANVMFTNCDIHDNVCQGHTGDGAGLWISGDSVLVDIVNSRIFDNTAAQVRSIASLVALAD